MAENTLKIAIGPLILQKTGFGGVQRHILSIIKYSRYKLKPITPFLSSYSQHFKSASSLLTTKKVSFLDIYGLIYSKSILPSYNIVHLHGHPEWPGLYFKSRKRNVKYIHSVHGIYTQEDYPSDWEYREMLNKRMIESCKESDVVVAVAQWLKDWLKNKGVNAVFIPNGINVDEFKDVNASDFKKKFNIREDFYLFAGRLDEYKRPRSFIELADRVKDKQFIMVGRDLTSEKVKNYYGKKLPENLLCLGELERKDILNSFSASRVFVLTSKYDTFPTVLLEAMSCRKVVVGANNAGPREMISHGKDGFLFDPDDIDDLHDNALKAWENEKMGENGFRKVKEKFDWPVVVKRIDEIYEKLT